MPSAFERNPKADRAKQFMPFASLRGYYDVVRKRERVESPRRMMTEERGLRLSQVLETIGKGSMVRVEYYDTDAYTTIEGMVAEVVPALRFMTVIKTKIPFDDIWDIHAL